MAGGYSPLVALDVKDDNFFKVANPLEDANKILQGRASTALTNAQTQEAQDRSAGMQAELPATSALAKAKVQQAKLATMQSADSMIADAASKIDPADPGAAAAWDQAMQGVVDAGAPDAKQFIGKFTPALHQRVVQSYGAPNALEAAAGAAGGGLPGSGFTPQQAQQWDTMFQGKSPKELQAAADQLAATKAALQKVLQSPNPAAEWNTQAQALGHDKAVGAFNPLKVQQLWQDVAPMEAYLEGRVAKSAAGIPGPVPATDVKEAGGGLYGVTPGPAGPVVKPLTPVGTWQLQGTDENGMGVYRNNITGEERTGNTKLGAKPGTANLGHSVFEKKQKAWLDTHPGDEQGALEFAGGRKIMSPAQATEAASAQAARDLQALTLGGQPPPDPAAYLKQTAATHYAEIMSAGSPGSAGPAPPAAIPPPAPDPGAKAAPPMASPGPQPPPRAIAKLKEGTITPFANGQVWTLRNGKPIRIK